MGPTRHTTWDSTAGINPTESKASISLVPSLLDARNVELSDDSERSTKEVWGVVSSNTNVPPKSTVIARLNLVSDDRTRIQVGQIGQSVLLEGLGATIPGI